MPGSGIGAACCSGVLGAAGAGAGACCCCGWGCVPMYEKGALVAGALAAGAVATGVGAEAGAGAGEGLEAGTGAGVGLAETLVVVVVLPDLKTRLVPSTLCGRKRRLILALRSMSRESGHALSYMWSSAAMRTPCSPPT